MKRIVVYLLVLLATVACSSRRAQSSVEGVSKPNEPRNYGYVIKGVYPHSTKSYTQGLEFSDGVLWEGTGQNGESVLQRVDLQSGECDVVTRLSNSDFGEGITILGDEIFQLTWTSNMAYVYERGSGELKRKHRYMGEGWGLTNDGSKLYMSNGTADIFVINPATFKRERAFTVTLRGEPVELLNELEWIEGKIWANVYTSNYVVVIDPKSGVVESIIDLSGLLSESELNERVDVLNGIAYDSASKRIFVTGKYWPKLFEIELIEK
ncbi:MAG: glutaminyl-peptide cyclotransferase [Alistipes sp.]|nr:glutaminyl-peptide cyclotransferase [Alistipes sp.]